MRVDQYESPARRIKEKKEADYNETTGARE
jgi:hypothetical protein